MKRLIFSFSAGAILTVPAYFLECAIGSIPAISSVLFLVISAPIEELLKLSGLLITRRARRTQAEGMILGAVLGAGFAVVECLMYLLRNPCIESAIFRPMVTLPMHVLTGAVLGFSSCSRRTRDVILGTIGAMILHSGFNAIAIASSFNATPWIMFEFPLLLISFLILRKRVRKSVEEEPYDVF